MNRTIDQSQIDKFENDLKALWEAIVVFCSRHSHISSLEDHNAEGLLESSSRMRNSLRQIYAQPTMRPTATAAWHSIISVLPSVAQTAVLEPVLEICERNGEGIGATRDLLRHFAKISNSIYLYLEVISHLVSAIAEHIEDQQLQMMPLPERLRILDEEIGGVLRETLFPQLSPVVLGALLKALDELRGNKIYDNELHNGFAETASLLEEMAVFKSQFWEPIFEATCSYFESISKQWHIFPMPVYLFKVIEIAQRENRIIETLPKAEYSDQLDFNLCDVLFERHLNDIVGLPGLGNGTITAEDAEDIRNAYISFDETPSSLDLVSIAEAYMRAYTQEIINRRDPTEVEPIAPEISSSMIFIAGNLYRNYFYPLSRCRSGRKEAALRDIRTTFGNRFRMYRTGFEERFLEYCLSYFACNEGSIVSVDTDVGNLEGLCFIFWSLEGKEVFLERYSASFAQRLLRETCYRAEISFLRKLQMEVGIFPLLFEMLSMIADMEAQPLLQERFLQWVSAEELGGCLRDLKTLPQVKVFLLKAIHWPSEPHLPLRIPKELRICQEVYEKFVSTQREYSSQSFRWDGGIVRIEAFFFCSAGHRRTISVFGTVLQGAILNLFNNQECLTFKKAVSSLVNGKEQMHLEIVKEAFESLTRPFPILQVEWHGGDLYAESLVRLNEGFRTDLEVLKLF